MKIKRQNLSLKIVWIQDFEFKFSIFEFIKMHLHSFVTKRSEAHLVTAGSARPEDRLLLLLKHWLRHLFIIDWSASIEIVEIRGVLSQIHPSLKDIDSSDSFAFLGVLILKTFKVDSYLNQLYPCELPWCQAVSTADEQLNMQRCCVHPFQTSAALIGKYFCSLNWKTGYWRSCHQIERSAAFIVVFFDTHLAVGWSFVLIRALPQLVSL
jgi:hypothetical protein